MQEKNIEIIINEIPRDTFHKKFVRILCQTEEFSYLTAFRGKNTPQAYKDRVRNNLISLDIPAELIKSDSDLDNAVTAIFSRAVALL